MIDLKVYINDAEVAPASVNSVHDADQVALVVTPLEDGLLSSQDISVYLEDYEIPLIPDGEGRLVTEAGNLFKDSFGHSVIRLFVGDNLSEERVFNITTSREKFESIKGMVSYLVKNNDHILDICFSRTKYKSRNDGEATATYDAFISLAEEVVASFDGRRSSLPQELHSKFVVVKEQVNQLNYYDIDPYDIIDNLEGLQQGYTDNSIKIRGRLYSLDNIPRESGRESFDLPENRVILAGLISIKQTLIGIESSVREYAGDTISKEGEPSILYARKKREYAIEDLYAQLTTDGMLKRINSVLQHVDDLLYILQKKLGIQFSGFLPPRITSAARESGLYFLVYEKLARWYSLGRPVMDVNDDLTKIRSTSRIYEFFTLYKLIDVLHKRDWRVVNATQHPFFGSFIPSKIRVEKEGVSLDIDYEKKIYGLDSQTPDKELVALSKTGVSSQYNYYTPDFLVTRSRNEDIDYFVFDAKYSSSSTLLRYSVLDDLFDKYYSNLAVYNKARNTLEKGPILAVNAIHPFGRGKMSKWPEQSARVIPDVSTVLLSNDNNNLYDLVDHIEL